MANEYKSESCGGGTVGTAGCEPPAAVVLFMEHQLLWLRQQMAAASPADEYWNSMKLVMKQFDGFVAGIQQFATAEERRVLTPISLYLLCSVGDLETINGLVRDDPLPTPSLATEDTLSCSGLISVVTSKRHQTMGGAGNGTGTGTGVVADIFAAQATWRSYYAMLRIYKVIGCLNHCVSSSGSPQFMWTSEPSDNPLCLVCGNASLERYTCSTFTHKKF
eukprot:SAG31_NODE_3113_length_4660_cov_2.867354_5_plen_220_part_00